MKERPILFSAPMIRAILEGRKTQTRRIAPINKLEIRQHDFGGTLVGSYITWSVCFSKPIKGTIGSHSGGRFSEDNARRIIASEFCPYGKPGDRLWVRETHAIVPRTAYAQSDGVQQALRPDDDHDAAIYREGFDRSNGGIRWRPSIHMPRWANRITLEITGVRVERLQDITPADCVCEGYKSDLSKRYAQEEIRALDWYRDLWEAINGPGSWEANPWVWVIEFERADQKGGV